MCGAYCAPALVFVWTAMFEETKNYFFFKSSWLVQYKDKQLEFWKLYNKYLEPRHASNSWKIGINLWYILIFYNMEKVINLLLHLVSGRGKVSQNEEFGWHSGALRHPLNGWRDLWIAPYPLQFSMCGIIFNFFHSFYFSPFTFVCKPWNNNYTISTIITLTKRCSFAIWRIYFFLHQGCILCIFPDLYFVT